MRAVLILALLLVLPGCGHFTDFSNPGACSNWGAGMKIRLNCQLTVQERRRHNSVRASFREMRYRRQSEREHRGWSAHHKGHKHRDKEKD